MKGCPGINVHCEGCKGPSGIGIALLILLALIVGMFEKHAAGIGQAFMAVAIVIGAGAGTITIAATIWFVRMLRRDRDEQFIMPLDEATQIATRTQQVIPAAEKQRAISPVKREALLGIVVHSPEPQSIGQKAERS